MIEINGNTIIINSDKPTLIDSRDFQMAFIRLLNEGNEEIRIDLLRPSFLPSELIGFLLDRKRALLSAGNVLKIININDTLRKTLIKLKISDYLGLM